MKFLCLRTFSSFQMNLHRSLFLSIESLRLGGWFDIGDRVAKFQEEKTRSRLRLWFISLPCPPSFMLHLRRSPKTMRNVSLFPLSNRVRMYYILEHARTEMHFLRKRSTRYARDDFRRRTTRTRWFLFNKVGSPSSTRCIWVIIRRHGGFLAFYACAKDIHVVRRISIILHYIVNS